MRSYSQNIWPALHTGLSLVGELLVREKWGELEWVLTRAKKMNVIFKALQLKVEGI